MSELTRGRARPFTPGTPAREPQATQESESRSGSRRERDRAYGPPSSLQDRPSEQPAEGRSGPYQGSLFYRVETAETSMTGRRLRFLHLAACRLALSAAIASVLAVGCAPSTSLTYNVAPAPGNPGQLEITLTLNGVSRDSLALKGYASDEVLRVSDFQAFGPRGARIAGDARVDTVLIESLRVDVPRFTLRGPLPPSLTVRYRVTPGRREGDSHMGFTGRCFGYVGEQFALVSGREIFLLPDPGAEAIRHIEVRFSLPSGWKAATTWESGRDNRLVDLRGSSPAEQMISATVGLGPFHERTFRLGDTRFILAFPNGIPPSREEQAVVQLTGVARYVHRLFGRDLGRSYMTIIVPTAPSGDEI